MKRIVLTTVITLMLGISTVSAQPVPTSGAAKPAATAPAPKAPAVAEKPAPMAAAVDEAAKKSSDAMDAMASVRIENKVEAPKPVWKSPAFWIGTVGGPILGIILSLLIAFGVIKKSWIEGDKAKTMMTVADKALPGIMAFVKGTKNEVDDAVAEVFKMLLEVVKARVGELTPEDEAKLKAMVESRKHELEADAKPEEKPEA